MIKASTSKTAGKPPRGAGVVGPVAQAALLVVLCAVPAAAAADNDTGKVDRVVVFSDRAEVTRATTVACSGGAASAVFSGLPESIDPRTLRGDADGSAVAVGVSSSRVALAEARDEHVRELDKDVRDLDDRLAALARAQVDDNERSSTMQSYGTYFRALAVEDMRNPKPDAGRWDTMLDALAADRASIVHKSVARAAEQRELERKRERLSARLARLTPASSPSTLQATVSVRCGAASQARVRLSYVVPGATWTPEYDLRFTGPAHRKTGEGKAIITVAGVVTQSTGEDWSDAEVWLSTARPNLGGEAPLPNPIWVNGHEEEKEKTLVQAQEHRAEDLKAGGKASGAARQVQLEDGGKSFVLKIPRRVTVHADGRPYWFPVDDVTTGARSALVVEPTLSLYAYQVASFSNPAPYPLMAGRVHVFRGATYVGDVDTEYRAPGEPMEISLGLDEEIAVERQDLLKQKREAGFFSGKQSIAHAYRTILHNRSTDDVTVEVREQIPVSKSEDITVKLDDDKTARGYSLDKLRGHLTWKVPLKRGASDKRDIAFTIALPRDWTLQ